MARLLLVALIFPISVAQACFCETTGENSLCNPDPDKKGTCICKHGYESTSATKKFCDDIDECATSYPGYDCVSNIKKCVNKIPELGSYVCQCLRGHAGDGKVNGTGCADIDECAEDSRNHCKGGQCTNIVVNNSGDEYYKCLCLPGFVTLHQKTLCKEQKCIFLSDTVLNSTGVLAGACGANFSQKQGAEIHLSAATPGKTSCELGCDAGYVKAGELSCAPNNDDRRETQNEVGIKKSTFTCTEQKCNIRLANYGAGVKAGTCSIGQLNALAGVQNCTLECDDGFTKSASGLLRCVPNNNEAEGKILGSIDCTAASCGLLDVKHSNHVGVTSGVTADTQEVTCDNGYTGGTAIAKCIPSGAVTSVWTYSTTCVAAKCEPLSVPHSNYSAGNTRDKTMDSFVVGCDDGYTGDTGIMTCSPSGVGTSAWTGAPKCEAALCATLTVDHSNNHSTGSTIGKTMDTVEVTCEDGYKKTGGENVTTCSPSGPETSAWTGFPTCVAASCDTVKVAGSDKAEGMDGKVGKTVEVKCDNGNDAIILCRAKKGTAQGAWSGLNGVCDAKVEESETTTSPSFMGVNYIYIGGGAAGGLLILLIIIVAICMCLKKLKKKKGKKSEDLRDRADTYRGEMANKVMDMGSCSDILLDSNQVVLGSSFAAGGHARIYNGTFGSEKVALKEDMFHVEGRLDEATAHETGLMVKMRHPHIVRFYGLWRSPNSNRIFMVLELCVNGDMGQYLDKHTVEKPLKYRWAVQVADALVYLHGRTPPIIHRDLKPSNILIDSQTNVKLTDFGIAKVDNSSRDMTMRVGTVAFMPPEAMDDSDDEDEPDKKEKASQKSSLTEENKCGIDGKKWDVYSLAICYAHLFTGKEVYEGLSNPRIFRQVPKGKRPDVPNVEKPLQDLMKKMWTKKHRDRPTMATVLKAMKKMQSKSNGGSKSSSDNSADASEEDGEYL